uniref:Uncharacterized protein n=1 Tax=Musa acuminata subsp. malaccensis TaxID=214687 RepID=A0A804J9D4_MUSAM
MLHIIIITRSWFDESFVLLDKM